MKKILTLMFLLVSMKTFGAQIVFEPGLDQCPFIKIDGEIEVGDSKKFKNLVEQMGRRYSNSCHSLNKTIRINSLGGSVDEALLIGREARLNSFQVIVMK